MPHARGVAPRRELPCRARPEPGRRPGRRHVPVAQHGRLHRAGRGDLGRPDRRPGRRGPAQRPRARRHRVRRCAARRAGRRRRPQRAGGRGRVPLQPQRRGAAPVRRPRRRRHLPLHPLRAHRRPAGVRQLRAARSQGALHLRGHRAARLAGRVRATRGGPDGRTATARPRSRSPRRHPSPTYLTALAAGPYHRVDGHLGGGRDAEGPARGALPGVDGRAPRARGDLHRHPAGPGLLRPRLRLPLPLGQVRLDLRPRVQPRRDGEPRPRHLHRGLHPPRRGDPGGPGPPGRGDPARDGAHVVRRPGDPALVGRHVAEGVVRRPDGLPRHGGGDRVRRRVGHLRRPAQGVGLPPGPAAHDAPDRRRPSTTSRRRGRTSTGSPTRRARRCSSS